MCASVRTCVRPCVSAGVYVCECPRVNVCGFVCLCVLGIGVCVLGIGVGVCACARAHARACVLLCLFFVCVINVERQ